MRCKNFLRRISSFVPLSLVAGVSIFVLACTCATTSAAQTNTTLVPSSYVTTSGGDGGQPVATSIDLLDESGYNPVSGKYVPFLAATKGVNYAGYRVYTLPTSIAPSAITAIQVQANYQGPKHSSQVWAWQIYNWSTNSYVAIGDNTAVTQSWYAWQILTFNVTGTLANYVRSSDGQIRVQLTSNNHSDDTYIDYEAVVVTSTAGVSVSVSPTTASLGGGGTQQFTATVSGSSNTAVTWSLTGLGTVSSSGLYAAPASVSSTSTATVKATSSADSTKSASATVTLNPVAISISPTSASVPTNSTKQFSEQVSYTGNTAVTWQVNGTTGGNSTIGTISTSGLYSAPSTIPSPATVTVQVISQADTTKTASASVTVTTVAAIPTPLHGVTVADDKDIRTTSYLNNVLTSLGNLSVTPTVRIVYTLEGSNSNKGAAASTYLSATQAIKQKGYVLGQPVDSSYMFCFDEPSHTARWNDYVNTLGSTVDMWEVGNEINGNWLDNSDPSTITGQTCPWTVPNTVETDVVNKMIDAYNIVKGAGKVAELTLYYEPNPGCDTSLPLQYDPMTWVDANVPANMKTGMDYVLVSFYQDNCPTYTPDWNTIFANINSRFPNAKLGIGEWGYSLSKPNKTALTALIQEGYSIWPNVTNWAGGGFYWEYGLDAVPYDGTAGSIWNVINTAMVNQH
jgi:glycosyl hydrolase family 114